MRQDFGHAFRLLLKSPGFTAAIVLSLALGIGANTAIFSLLDAVMWRTLPVQDPASLWVVDPNLSYQQYRSVADENQVADLAAYATVLLNVSVNGSVEPTTDGQLVTGGYFSLLGVTPVIGRTIGEDEDRVPNGILTFAVVQRTSELGPRMALGARPTELVGMVLWEAMLLATAGIAIGVPAALFIIRIAGSQISGLLFELTPSDPWTIGLASIVLVAVAAAAAYLPARRSSRVNPLTALKTE